MKRALFVLALAPALAGCVTTAGLVRKERTTLPILAAAAAADLVIGSIVLSQATDLSAAGSIAAAIAFTGVDVGIGCITGACAALRP